MSDIKITLDEQNQLEFDADIQGIETDNIDVRFIIEANGMDLSFNGKMNDKTVTVDIPILSEHIKPKEYKCRLEFIVEGAKYFSPMETTVEMVQPVRITAGVKENSKKKTSKKEVKEDIQIVEPKVSVKITKKEKTTKDRIIENLQEMAMSEDAEELQSIYKKNVVLNENEEIDINTILSTINPICEERHGMTFTDFVINIRGE